MKNEMQIIKEMARIICKPTSNKGNCDKCGFSEGCSKFDDAKALCDAGYRKQDEVVTELLDEIIHVLDETSLAFQHGMSMKGIRAQGKTILYGKYEACSQFMSYLINLKNKYTSRGD